MPIHIPQSKPTLNKADIQNIPAIIQSLQLAQGKQVELFECKVAHFQRLKYGVATNSGTAALHLSLLALGIKKGDQVIIPSYVCTALLNAVNHAQATAIIADVNLEDCNISLTSVKRKITSKTKAIIVPHMFGQAADMSSLVKLKIPIIEDCAQAIGAKYKKKLVGSFGALCINSFYATKMLTTGEGGMVCSNNTNLIKTIRDLRAYDKNKNYKIRYNYKMTELQASIGISQIKKLPLFIKRRKTIANLYTKGLQNLNITLPTHTNDHDPIYYRYIVKVPKNKKKFITLLNKKGVQVTSPVDKPLHSYLKLSKYTNTDQLINESISLPIYPSLTNEEVAYVIKSIKQIL